MFNDLNAPRFNNRKYRENIVSKELYKKWKEENNSKLSFIEFRNICWAINREICEIVKEEPDGVRLPKGMGDIYIGYVPQARVKGVDYKTSKEYGKKIYHGNWNSAGKIGKVIYGVIRRYIFKRAWMWSFSAHRTFSREVSKCLQENPQIYKNSIEKRR